jgi:hypothetical protein
MRHFSAWPREFALPARGGSALFPDAYALFHHRPNPREPAVESAAFFEWDRSTEARRVLRKKAEAYDRFYRSGDYARRQGGRPEESNAYPFRTVFVVPNDERRNNVLEEFARPHAQPLIADQFWVTTEKEVVGDPFGPIYLHIGDYINATRGTRYDPATHVTKYRTRERDQLVRERTTKRPLLDLRADSERRIQIGKAIIVLKKNRILPRQPAEPVASS